VQKYRCPACQDGVEVVMVVRASVMTAGRLEARDSFVNLSAGVWKISPVTTRSDAGRRTFASVGGHADARTTINHLDAI